MTTEHSNPPETILIPVRIDELARWLTNDTERYDEGHPPADGWTIEPTEADIIETASTLIDDYASNNYRHDDEELLDRILALLVKIAQSQQVQS